MKWGRKTKSKLPTLLGGLPLRDQQQTKPDLISSLLITRGVKCDADQRSSRLVLKPSVCPLQSRFMACHHQWNKDTANQGPGRVESFTTVLWGANWLADWLLARPLKLKTERTTFCILSSTPQIIHSLKQCPPVKIKLHWTLATTANGEV